MGRSLMKEFIGKHFAGFYHESREIVFWDRLQHFAHREKAWL